MKQAVRDRDYVEHIEAAICKIRRYLEDRSEAEFMEDDLLQDTVVQVLPAFLAEIRAIGAELKE